MGARAASAAPSPSPPASGSFSFASSCRRARASRRRSRRPGRSRQPRSRPQRFPGTPRASVSSASCARAAILSRTATASSSTAPASAAASACSANAALTVTSPCDAAAHRSAERSAIHRMPARERQCDSGIAVALCFATRSGSSDLREFRDRRALIGRHRRALGHVEALEAGHLVVLEVHDEAPLGLAAVAPVLEVIDVVPAVLVEAVRHERRAEQVPHLRARHADLELIDGLPLQVVALLNVHAIDAAAKRRGESQGGERENGEAHRGPLGDNRGAASYLIAEPPRLSSARAPPEAHVEGKDLRKAGLKVTLPRLKILEILEGSTTRHLSAEDIYRSLLESNEDIGLATVYRVLTQFEAAGLVTRHHFEDGMAVFELNQGTHHDHIVCLDCGRVEEFMDSGIEERQTAVASKLGFTIRDHSLILYGHCRRENCPYRTRKRA